MLEECDTEFGKKIIACKTCEEQFKLWWSDDYAEHLINNGVIILPCKVGDTVYKVCYDRYPTDDYHMQWAYCWEIQTAPFRISMFDAIGERIFLTKEEAEKALAEIIMEEKRSKE